MDEIERILKEARTVAVVGLSSKPRRPSYEVAAYLQAHGYRVIPVNPKEAAVLGEQAYPDLRSVPVAIDLVDVFRRSELVAPAVADAITVGARFVWLQDGVRDDTALASARAAGLLAVQDNCVKRAHAWRHADRRIEGGP